MNASDLAILGRRANAEHRAVGKAHGKMLQHALEAGKLLADAKDKLDYGQWGPWCSEHLEYSARTAQVYMQLAAAPALADAQSSAEVSIGQALKQIAQPRPPSTGEVTSMLRGMAGDSAGAEPRERAKPEPQSATAWTSSQERKWERARVLIEEALGGLIDAGARDELSPYAISELLRASAVKARHGAAALDELAFTFEQ